MSKTREKRSVSSPRRRTLILYDVREDFNETTPQLRKIILNLFRKDLKTNITDNELYDVHRFGGRKLLYRPVSVTFVSGERYEEIIEARIKVMDWFRKGIKMEGDDFHLTTSPPEPEYIKATLPWYLQD